ncbi:hypothetical protein Tco_1173336 [Tanacetum coccineum]
MAFHEILRTSNNQVGLLKKPEESTGFADIVDFLKGSHIRYSLTHNPTIHDSLVKQFWQTVTASTLADGTLELRATIDTLEYTIIEASVRSKLQLADASRISMLPNTEIFEGMGNMGYPADGRNISSPTTCEVSKTSVKVASQGQSSVDKGIKESRGEKSPREKTLILALKILVLALKILLLNLSFEEE